MSKLIRRIALASTVAAVLALVPVTISPAGSVELNGACASGNCESAPRGFCAQPDAPPVLNAKPSIG